MSVSQESKNISTLIIQSEQLKVSGDGVFYTLQGEGETMGFPACFLRLHLCNLQCSWCDTRYTWDSTTREFWEESEDWSVEETKKKIEQAWGCKNKDVQKRVVITGGEPMMQKINIEKLMRSMPEWFFEIETNGTILPTEYLLEHCQFNCSPKLAHSKNVKVARIKEEVLRVLNTVNSSFKFVVSTKEDLDEIENDFLTPFQIDRTKVIVMPLGVTVEEIQKNALCVAVYALEKGFRFLDRMHVMVWGEKRGV